MASFYRSEVITAMREQALVPVFYHGEKEVVLGIVGACVRGGSRLVEFTNRGEGAADLFGEVIKTCRKEYPRLMVGVGSVRDEITAGIYIGKGADFVVGPTFNPRISEICNRHGVAYSPGCGSATEVNNAEAAGSEIVKVFPGGEVGGPEFLKAIHGPAPKTQMMPTGGVDITVESLYEWLATGGAAAVGIGGQLIRKEHVAKKDFAAMEAGVRKALRIIRAVQCKIKAKEGKIFLGVRCIGVPADDATSSAKTLAGLAGMGTSDCADANCVAGSMGACLHVGKGPFLALVVSDLEKAIEIAKNSGAKVEGKPEIHAESMVKSVRLAEGAFGLGMPVVLATMHSEELEKLLSK